MRSYGPKSALSSPRDASKAGFLSLPGELRNKVYRLVLVEDLGPIGLKVLDKGEMWDQKVKALQVGPGNPTLLQLCRQVHRESSRIYYEENVFRFQDDALNVNAVQAFRERVGVSLEMIRRIVVHRSYQIGDMKPIQIRFEAQLNDKKRIVIARPQNEHKPFPGVKSKIRGKFYEPCRCEVEDLAESCHCGRRTNGEDLIYFLEGYVQLINSIATHAEIEVCKKCNCVRRT